MLTATIALQLLQEGKYLLLTLASPRASAVLAEVQAKSQAATFDLQTNGWEKLLLAFNLVDGESPIAFPRKRCLVCLPEVPTEEQVLTLERLMQWGQDKDYQFILAGSVGAWALWFASAKFYTQGRIAESAGSAWDVGSI